MVIIMQIGASPEQVEAVIQRIESAGLRPFVNPGVERKVIAVLGAVDAGKLELLEQFSAMAGVERVALISEPYKLASRASHAAATIVRVGEAAFGSGHICVVAGPCSVESREQMLETARAVAAAGASVLRGGAFKPRTSPYSFQGLGKQGLEILAEARAVTGLPVVTEVLDPQEVGLVAEYADMLQVGARNMQNFRLLQSVGRAGKPVLLKRGPGCRLRDLLLACEYIMVEGNRQVLLCERGITTFEEATRFTTDINAIPFLKQHTHLPVILDPSHSAGDWRYVIPLSLAAVAAGADGVMVEVHPDPSRALSDGPQSLRPERFRELMEQLGKVAEAVGRPLAKV